tara:strand:- start:4322 stop:4483 length:162 start_codon:yes stop_codon:yes gene_type:complete
MPGMTERRRHMRGETKTARGDYNTKGYNYGGDVKYTHGGDVKKQKRLTTKKRP